MTPERAVSNTVARFFAAVDRGDWERVAAYMSDPIHIDYESFGGGPPADSVPADVVARWRGILPGFDHTHHQLGNLDIEVDGDDAEVRAYVTAAHVIDDRVWTVVGRYELRLRRLDGGWRLTVLRLVFSHQTGDVSLPAAAIELQRMRPR